MITIESDTGYNVSGEIVRKREADGLVLAIVSKPDYTGAPIKHTVYLCREVTRAVGRKRERRLEWLSFRDAAPEFGTREEAVAYAMGA